MYKIEKGGKLFYSKWFRLNLDGMVLFTIFVFHILIEI